jgi:hypothetical protein
MKLNRVMNPPAARALLTGIILLGAAEGRADLKAPALPSPEPVPIPATAASTRQPAVEAAPVLSAATLLGTEILIGPAYRVRAAAPTDGYMAHFTIDSDFGTFQCAGVDQARQRIHEIGAISILVSESKGDLFAEAVKKSVEQPVEAVKNIVKDPGRTLAQAPRTVGHFFKRLGSSVKAGAEDIANRTAENSLPAGTGTPPPRATTGEHIAAAGRGLIGFDKAKLDCAKQLDVDPYSDNPVLQEQLEKVAWVYFAGGLPIRVGAAAASGGASLALTSTKLIGLPEEVYSLTPSELALRNRESLDVLGVADDVKADFTSNPRLTPTLKSSMLRSLERLSPATGRPAFIGLAARCETVEQAQFLDRSLRLLADRQQLGLARYTEVMALGRVPAAVNADGGLEVPAVVDFVSWTDEVAVFAQRDDLRAAKPTLLLTGQASTQAVAGFTDSSWRIVQP